MPPNFAYQHRWWQTSPTRPSPRGIRQASTRCKWQPRPERQTTQEQQRPNLMSASNTRQRSSALPPRKTLKSTWTTSFQLSMDSPWRGANFSITSSTILTGFSAPTRSRTPTLNTLSPKISWGKNMCPGPPKIQSLGGTSTKSPTCYALPLDDNRRWWPH